MSHIVVDKLDGLAKQRKVISFHVALLMTVTLVGCGGSGRRYVDYDAYESSDADVAEETAEEAAEEARQGAYAAVGASSDGTGADASSVSAYDVEQPSFDYCTNDCSGHEAGFEWARDNEVTDESECGGNSQSFRDGCVQFAEERQTQADLETQETAEHAAIEAAEAAEYEFPEKHSDYDRGSW